MHQALRPYVTAGVAVIGAGLIAATPVATASAVDIHPMPDVALTAGVELGDIDFTSAWTDVFDTAKSNSDIVTAGLQDAQTALSEALAANPTIDGKELFAALTFLDGDQKTYVDEVSKNTLDSLHSLMFGVLTNPDADPPLLPADILPVVNFLASPISGSLIGSLGPSLAPVASLMNSFQAISDNLSGDNPDYTAALQEMVNIPANMVGGMLNGSTLDLDALVPLVAESGLLPEGIEIDHLSLALGGLFSPGDVSTGLVVGEGDDAVHLGGSIFNALGLGVNLGGSPLPIDGVGVGPLAAWAALENILAQALAGELPPLEPDVTPDVDPALGTDWLAGFDLGDLFGLS